MCWPGRWPGQPGSPSVNERTLDVSSRMPFTVASRHEIGFTIASSIAAIAFFEPLVTPVVIAKRLPEPRLILVLDAETTDPFGAFPEIPPRYDEPRGATVLRRKRLAVVLPRDEGLAVQDVAERQVRRIAAVGIGDHECSVLIELDVLEEGVEAHSAPLHVELRPLRDTADIDDPFAVRQCHELGPRPDYRVADEAFDRERPAIERGTGRRPRRQDREVSRLVLPGRDPIPSSTGTLLRPTTDEAACDEPLSHGSSSPDLGLCSLEAWPTTVHSVRRSATSMRRR